MLNYIWTGDVEDLVARRGNGGIDFELLSLIISQIRALSNKSKRGYAVQEVTEARGHGSGGV